MKTFNTINHLNLPCVLNRSRLPQKLPDDLCMTCRLSQISRSPFCHLWAQNPIYFSIISCTCAMVKSSQGLPVSLSARLCTDRKRHSYPVYQFLRIRLWRVMVQTLRVFLALYSLKSLMFSMLRMPTRLCSRLQTSGLTVLRNLAPSFRSITWVSPPLSGCSLVCRQLKMCLFSSPQKLPSWCQQAASFWESFKVPSRRTLPTRATCRQVSLWLLKHRNLGRVMISGQIFFVNSISYCSWKSTFFMQMHPLSSIDFRICVFWRIRACKPVLGNTIGLPSNLLALEKDFISKQYRCGNQNSEQIVKTKMGFYLNLAIISTGRQKYSQKKLQTIPSFAQRLMANYRLRGRKDIMRIICRPSGMNNYDRIILYLRLMRSSFVVQATQFDPGGDWFVKLIV